MHTVPNRYASMTTLDLIRECAGGASSLAWEEFVERFHRPILLSVLRVVRYRTKNVTQLSSDLVQETYLKLCADGRRNLLEFTLRNPDAADRYVGAIAINVARDHFKASDSQKRSSNDTNPLTENFELPAHGGNPSGQLGTERQILIGEIERCLTKYATGPDQKRDFLIFQLHYQQGFSAKAIAALPSIGLTA